MESNERFLSVEIDILAPWLNLNLGQKIFIFKIRTIYKTLHCYRSLKLIYIGICDHLNEHKIQKETTEKIIRNVRKKRLFGKFLGKGK